MMHLLLIEDDLALGQILHNVFRQEKLTLEWVRSSKDAQKFIHTNHYDCILLDLTLPDDTGIALLQRWREAGLEVPIIIITAQSALEIRLMGLDSGADDFILKPFAPAELIARIYAVVRRYIRQSHAVWTFGQLSIEPKKNVACINQRPIDLTPREFTILVELARHVGTTVSKNSLAERLMPLGDPLDFSTLEVHISNLRRKIGADYIHTIRGIGYQLNAPQ